MIIPQIIQIIGPIPNIINSDFTTFISENEYNPNDLNDQYIKNFPIVNNIFNYSDNVDLKYFHETFNNKICIQLNNNLNNEIKKYNSYQTNFKNSKFI